MQKVAFYTLGCKVNQYETEALKELFAKNEYEISGFDEVCDVYVVNSCTVTATGDKKSRQAVSRARRLNKDAVIALIGCYAQHLTEKETELSEADIVLGTANKLELFNLVEKNLKSRKANDIKEFDTFCETPVTGALSDRARAYLKIQDGCNRFCSYCIIPYVRGKVKSRELSAIQKEAEKLAENGKHEVILTGIQVGAYGDDLGKSVSLIDAVETVASVKGIERIRLSSVEPVAITRDFLERCKKLPEFCCHFHLSLQSGSDKILKAMNRRYTKEEYSERVDLIREYFPDSAITTDIIAGFPGETDQDFMETMDFARKCKFAQIHAFPYSPREGTKASEMSGLPLRKVRNERARQLILLSEQLRNQFLETQMGKIRPVYIEKQENNVSYGYTDNYIYVGIENSNKKTGEICDMSLTQDIIKNNLEESQ